MSGAVDRGQFRALFGAFLKLDFRRARAGGSALRQREVSVAVRMGVSFAFYLVMGTMVGMTAFAATDRRTYAAVALG